MSMKNRYIYTFAFIFVCALRLLAVEKDSLRGLFDLPMDHQQILSGTFAELRPAHFHAGVDFKTQGVVGKKIYSPASGYISHTVVMERLFISHTITVILRYMDIWTSLLRVWTVLYVRCNIRTKIIVLRWICLVIVCV